MKIDKIPTDNSISWSVDSGIFRREEGHLIAHIVKDCNVGGKKVHLYKWYEKVAKKMVPASKK